MDQVERFVSQPATAAAPPLTAHRRPLKALTGIRFFAAFYVVIFHTRVGSVLLEHGLRPAGNFFKNGFLAVPLFFILSGFILAYTYRGQIETRADHRRFWEARFARIWPVYVVSLLLSSVPSLVFPPLPRALAVLFMVQAWDPFNLGLAGDWNMVCWTLSAEALFYVLFPFLQVWLERFHPRAQLFAIAGFALACIVLNTCSRTLGYVPHGAFLHIPLAICHIPEFCTGVALGNYFLMRAPHSLPGKGLFTYVSFALTLFLLTRPDNPLTSVIMVGYTLLLFGLAAERTLLSRFLSSPLLLLGGAISYSIYLMQMPLKVWVRLVADKLHIGSESIRMGITAVGLILIAFLLFRLVEDPARKVIRSFFAAVERRRRLAPQVTSI